MENASFCSKELTMKHDSIFTGKTVPESGHIIEILDENSNVKALTWVADYIGYSMNGCFKVRDKQGIVRLVSKSQGSVSTQRWKTVI